MFCVLCVSFLSSVFALFLMTRRCFRVWASKILFYFTNTSICSLMLHFLLSLLHKTIPLIRNCIYITSECRATATAADKMRRNCYCLVWLVCVWIESRNCKKPEDGSREKNEKREREKVTSCHWFLRKKWNERKANIIFVIHSNSTTLRLLMLLSLNEIFVNREKEKSFSPPKSSSSVLFFSFFFAIYSCCEMMHPFLFSPWLSHEKPSKGEGKGSADAGSQTHILRQNHNRSIHSSWCNSLFPLILPGKEEANTLRGASVAWCVTRFSLLIQIPVLQFFSSSPNERQQSNQQEREREDDDNDVRVREIFLKRSNKKWDELFWKEEDSKETDGTCVYMCLLSHQIPDLISLLFPFFFFFFSIFWSPAKLVQKKEDERKCGRRWIWKKDDEPNSDKREGRALLSYSDHLLIPASPAFRDADTSLVPRTVHDFGILLSSHTLARDDEEPHDWQQLRLICA